MTMARLMNHSLSRCSCPAVSRKANCGAGCARAGILRTEAMTPANKIFTRLIGGRSARQLRRAQIGPFRNLWHLRRIFLECFEDEFDGLLQLRVLSPGIVLWRDLDVHVRFCAVVFDSPFHIFKPKGKLWLGGDAAVNQPVPRPDSDDAAPGSFPHQRSEVHQLERMRDDIAVGTRVFVAYRYHRTEDRFGRIRCWNAPTRKIVTDSPAREFFQNQ